jgi:hypothetical protein
MQNLHMITTLGSPPCMSNPSFEKQIDYFIAAIGLLNQFHADIKKMGIIIEYSKKYCIDRFSHVAPANPET